MTGQLSMNNSRDIICNSIRIIEGNSLNDVGNLFQLLTNQINAKINTTDVYDKIAINAIFENYYKKDETTTLLDTKLDATEINNFYNKVETDAFLNVRYTKTEADTLLNLKANATDVYTKIESNNLLNNKLDTSIFNTQIILKANVADIYNKSLLYTKTETIDLLNLKANSIDVYSKIDTNNLLNNKLDTSIFNTQIILKANVADIYNKSLLYTKTETIDLLNAKQDTLNSSSIITVARIKSPLVEVISDTTTDARLFMHNTNENGRSSIFMIAGAGNTSAESHYLTTLTEHIISTNTIHPILLWANRLNTLTPAMTINTNNTVTFSSTVTCDKLFIQDSDVLAVLNNTDNLLGNKLDTSIFNTQIALKANVTDVYNKSLLFTKSETNNLLDSKQDTLNSSSIVTVNNLIASGGILASELTVFTEIAGEDTMITVNNNSGSGFASYYLVAGGVQARHFVGGGVHVIATTTAHPVILHANITSSTIRALTVNIDNTVDFGSSVNISGSLTANGTNILTTLDNLLASVNAKQDTLNSSSIVTVNNLIATGGILASELTVFTEIAGEDTMITVNNNSGSGFASYYLVAGGVQARHFVGGGVHVIATTTAHPVILHANITSSTIRALTVNIDNTVDFGSSVNISGSLTLNGTNILTTLGNLSASVNANTFNISTLDLTVSSGFLARYTKLQSDERYYVKAEVDTMINNVGTNNFLYEFDAGLYKTLNLQHSYGIVLAITSNANPTSSEILLSMEATSGVTINTSASVVDNLGVGGQLIVGSTNILNEITNLQDKIIYEIKEINAMRSDMTIGKVIEFSPGVCRMYSNLNVPVLNVQDESGDTRIVVRNTNNFTASLYLNAGTVAARQYVGSDIYLIGTDTPHPIIFNCDRFNSSKAMTITAANDVVIHKSLLTPSLRVEDATPNTAIRVNNTAGLAASLYLEAGGLNAQQYAGFGEYVIATNTVHPIVLRADRFNSTKAMTISAVNNVTVHKSLTVSGPVTVPFLLVQDSVNHLSAFVHNTSNAIGARASYKLQSGGSGMMQYVSSTEFVIGTDNAIPIRLRPNRLSSVATALTLNVNGTSTFGGRVNCPSLFVDGVDVLTAIVNLTNRLLALEGG